MQIADAVIFKGIDLADVEAMLPCLKCVERTYERGELVLRAGEPARRIGVLLSGRLHIEIVDAWGSVTVLESVNPGEPFAVAYACGKDAVMDVDVVADEKSLVAMLDVGHAMRACPKQCACHATLVRNKNCMGGANSPYRSRRRNWRRISASTAARCLRSCRLYGPKASYNTAVSTSN